MTPKEKAKELVYKFEDIEPYSPNKDRAMCLFESKQCALICVDEIMKQRPQLPSSYTSTIEYWQEVKKEIEAL